VFSKEYGMTRKCLLIVLVASLTLIVLGSNLDAKQCFKGCPREMVEEGPVPAEALKTLIDQAESIFVGTVASVEPSVPAYPTGENRDWKEYYRIYDEFKATNVVTFTVEAVWKGPAVETIKLRGNDLLLIYENTKKFLIFLGKEDEKGVQIDVEKNVFRFIEVTDPDYHWDVDLGKPAEKKSWNTQSFRSNKRLPAEYGPFVMKWDRNSHLWGKGDTASWDPALKKATAVKLATIDPKFKDPKHREEVFALTTRGCQFTKDEWDRSGGIGFIGWEPCPLPLSLLEAYVRVRNGS
jgi:hypothetical protein